MNDNTLRVIDDLLWIHATLERVTTPDGLDMLRRSVATAVGEWRALAASWESGDGITDPSMLPVLNPGEPLAYRDGTAVVQHLSRINQPPSRRHNTTNGEIA